jgi:hypothetical protein
MIKLRPCFVGVTSTLLLSGLAQAQVQNWSTGGANSRQNGLVSVDGPDTPNVLWQGGEFSYIAYQPFIEGRSLFTVRQNDWVFNIQPGNLNPTDSPIIAMNLDTGAELWRVNLPLDQIEDVPPDPELDDFLFPRSWLPEVNNDWTTWIFGVSNGRLYASRSGNGGRVASPLYCIDSATGAILWSTAGTGPGDPLRSTIHASTWSGGLFAPNGDPIVVCPTYIDRYDAQTGARLWRTRRVANVWEYGGGAINGNAVYVADLVGASNRVKRFNLSTGAFEYQGPPMIGGNLENAPFIGLDGSIYVPRAQNGDFENDKLYCFTDNGTAITEKWNIQAHGGGAAARWGVGPDGSIYSMSWSGTPINQVTFGQLQRLNPDTGAILNESTTVLRAAWMQIHMAIDQRGVIYVSNGHQGGPSFFPDTGKLYSFNADLTQRWVVETPGSLHQGGPALGTDGTLVLVGTENDIWAYRTAPTPAGCDDIDFNNNGVFPEDQDVIDFFDVLAGGTPVTCDPVAGCNDIDFNNNAVFPEDQDVVDFFNVLAGGACP